MRGNYTQRCRFATALKMEMWLTKWNCTYRRERFVPSQTSLQRKHKLSR